MGLQPDAASLARVRTAVGPLKDRDHASLRWLDPATWHVTVQFLGSLAAERLPDVTATLDGLRLPAADYAADSLSISGFPKRRPSVVAVELAASDAVAAAAGATRDALRRIGLEPDKPFRPHLTVARLYRGKRMTLPEAGGCGALNFAALKLWRSETLAEGPRYTPLWTLPLSGTKGTSD